MGMQNTEFILVLLFINYYIIFHTNTYKPTFATPCIQFYNKNTRNVGPVKLDQPEQLFCSTLPYKKDLVKRQNFLHVSSD